MAHSDRKTRFSLRKYYDLYDEKEKELTHLLSYRLNSDWSDEKLTEFIASIKSSYKSFSNICHELISSLTNNGSLNEAYEYKDIRNEKRNEVKEHIALGKSLIHSSHINDLVSDLDSLSQYSSLGRANSVLVDFGDEAGTVKTVNLPTDHCISNSLKPQPQIAPMAVTKQLSDEIFNLVTPTSIYKNVNFCTAQTTQSVNYTQSAYPSITTSLPIFNVSSSMHTPYRYYIISNPQLLQCSPQINYQFI